MCELGSNPFQPCAFMKSSCWVFCNLFYRCFLSTERGAEITNEGLSLPKQAIVGVVFTAGRQLGFLKKRIGEALLRFCCVW